MRQTLIPLFLVAFFGIGLAIVLFPSEEERALMYIKDKEFSEALEIYEKLIQKGRLKPEPVKALTDLYVQYGEINRAIELLEQFIAENPEHLEARQQIGTYYQYAQRPGDYLRNLVDVVKFAPSKERLKELSDIYNFNGEYDKQIEILKQLIAYPDPEPEYFVYVAHLLAGKDRIDESIAILGDYRLKFPAKITPDTLEFMMSLLLSKHRQDEAYKWSKEWFDIHPWPQAALRIADIFSQKGQLGMALTLLESMEGNAKEDITFQVTLLQYQYNSGKIQDVFTKLKDFSTKGKLPQEAFPIFVDLSLNAKDLTFVTDESKRQDITLLPDELLVRLVKQVTQNGDKEYLNFVLSQYDKILLENRPLFTAELYYAGNNLPKAKEWADIVLKTKEISIEENIRFSDLLYRIDMKPEAISRIDIIENALNVQSRLLQERDYILLAKDYINLEKINDGLSFFEKHKSLEPESESESGWALLAASDNQNEKVKEWFLQQKRFDPVALEDLQRITAKSGNYDLAVLTAEKLYELFPGTIQELLLGRSLLYANRPVEAVQHIKPHVFSYPEAEAMYAVGLKRTGDDKSLSEFMENQKKREAEGGGGRREDFIYTILDFKEYALAMPYVKDLALTKGEGWVALYVDTGVKSGATKEISDFLLEYLDKADIDLKKKEEFVYVLIDVAGQEVALPHIKTLAFKIGGNWGYSYIDILKKRKNMDELRLFLKEWGIREDTPLPMRRYAAHELLKGGMKSEAEQIFMNIARIQNAKSQDIQDLLFIWGVGKNLESLKFLSSRADASFVKKDMDDFSLWLNYITDYVSPEETLKYLQSKNIEPLKTDNKVVMSYAMALYKAKKFILLEDFLLKAIGAEQDPKNILELAILASDLSEQATASVGYAKVIKTAKYGFLRVISKDDSKKSDLDRIALRRIGFSAFIQKNLSEAEQYLRSYIRKYGKDNNDFEAYYFLGECLWLTDRKSDADYFYSRAQKIITNQKEKTNDLLLVKAGIKQRYGLIDDAIDVYEDMRKDMTSNRSLQADYALILLDNNKNMMARHMLDMD
ncbi:MAG: tetratricopeptide repeat protein [Alphaproteobacteria bacterium]|nr:tetratricopeptide repeat protein [Alphaproteobacteria bacterium]